MDAKLREELRGLVRDMRENPRDWSGFELADTLEKSGLVRADCGETRYRYFELAHPTWHRLRITIPSAERVNSVIPLRAADLLEEVIRLEE